MLADPPVKESPVGEAKPSSRRLNLYAPRKKIYPKRGKGRFRNFKWLVMLITLAIYYVTPWIRWDRGPLAPDQAVLVDLANRRFYFFFIEIWPQEFYYVAGMLVMAGIGLFLVTSTVGRAWCGYACPQTVWVDLFLVVERGIEGDRNARMKLEAAPWSFDKISKRVAKHGTWLVIGALTGGAWIYYFADAPTLLHDVVTLQAPLIAYATIALLTATTYVFGGLMREQVCTYMCPWPRIQAAMLDENSLTVTYNDWRGEPRSRHAKKALAEGKAVGDCVDCDACVVVCPMGIDIRNGQQLECITCALCIDACDDVMTKLGKEQGLISYTTLADYNANMALAAGGGGTIVHANVRDPLTGRLDGKVRHSTWRSIVRPRTVLYFAGWAAIGVAMLVSLSMRTTLTVSVLHDRNPLYVMLKDGSIRNGYEIKISNMTAAQREMTVTTDGLPGAELTTDDTSIGPARALAVTLEPDKVKDIRFYVEADTSQLPPGPSDFTIIVTNGDGSLRTQARTTFQTPMAEQ